MSVTVDVSSRRGISEYFTTGIKKKKIQFGLCSFWLNKQQVPLFTEKKEDIAFFLYKKAFY